jgi:hypothetical protein
VRAAAVVCDATSTPPWRRRRTVQTTATSAAAITITANKIQRKVITPCTHLGYELNPYRSSAETLGVEHLGAVDTAYKGAVK